MKINSMGIIILKIVSHKKKYICIRNTYLSKNKGHRNFYEHCHLTQIINIYLVYVHTCLNSSGWLLNASEVIDVVTI